MGEHAAVYGRPAVVAAIDRRLSVEITPNGGEPGVVELDLPQLRVRRRVLWNDLRAYTEVRREAWRRYSADPSPERFAAVRGDDPAHLVLVALGETDAFLEPRGRASRASIRVALRSDLPLGAGFGSSAAAAVALVEALLAMEGEEAEPEAVFRLAQEAERRQHGRPSGVDAATVQRGGLLWVERTAEGALETRSLATTSPHLSRFRLYHSGEPTESTGDVVAAVAAVRRADPVAIERRFERMATATRSFCRELTRGDDDSAAVAGLVRAYQAELEALGVVPLAVRESIAEIESLGGSAKISGAGSLRGPGAGSVLVYWPGEAPAWTAPEGWEALDCALAAEGVRPEDATSGSKARDAGKRLR